LKKSFCFLLVCFLLTRIAGAQSVDSIILPARDSLGQDTLIQKDSLPVIVSTDPVSKRPATNEAWEMKTGGSVQSLSQQILAHHPYFGFASPPRQPKEGELKNFQGKEWLFYLVVLLLILYGLLRRLFPKYFSDLFRLFFRTTIKQRQIKEQLMQTPLPSLLLNGFFIISGALYLSFVLQHFELNPLNNFWILVLYCCAGLSLIYFIKFLGLKVSGWLFNMEEAAHSYIFIVFVVNKMIGILLLPFLVIIALTTGDIYSISFTLSWCLIGGLLIYRFILTYSAIRNQVKVNPFHFFLYLCAFEIAPLLLIYKGLLLFFSLTT
jgi:Domain of unknown function (DUF4271)